MLEIRKLASFYYTYKLGSQVKAGSYLGITQSTVASNIKNLEKDLGTVLIKGRSNLTESGKELFKYLSIYIPEMEEVENKIKRKEISSNPQLIIGGTSGVLVDFISKYVPTFLDEEKNLQMTMKTFELGRDLKNAFEECDVIISDSFHNHWERKKLHTFSFCLYASKDYIKKHGTPSKPKDLDNHRIVEFISDEENPFVSVESMLHVGSNRPRKRAVLTNSSICEARLVNNGAGIGCISPESENVDLNNLHLIDIGIPETKIDVFYYFKKNSPQSNPLILKFYDLIQREKKSEQ